MNENTDPFFELRSRISGDIAVDLETKTKFSRDTSLFERVPSAVIFPRSKEDVAEIVRYIRGEKLKGENISVTGRSAGTDMSGGPLTRSIVMGFGKYMTAIGEVEGDTLTAEPGAFYRDFEKRTLAKGLLFPSYPASRELCAMGGIVNNNSGGELSLSYGKTEKYVEQIEVVLSDGTITTLKELNQEELEQKKSLDSFEGEIYRKMDELTREHSEEIEKARPKVSKNSAGYALWNIRNKEKNTFNLAKLFVGAQGTLGMLTSAKMKLIQPKKHHAMLVVFLKDLDILPDVVHKVLQFNPESFESYDEHTFKFAVRFLPQIIKNLGAGKFFSLGMSFLPEVWMVLRGGVPKLVLIAEFAEDTHEAALQKAHDARKALFGIPVSTEIAKDENAAKKYWIVRRESFSLLRKNMRGFYASPFIDDFVVDPNTYPTFLPELNTILEKYHLIYTIAGHVGNGNFHIIPLMDLTRPETKDIVLNLSHEVYVLVTKYGGSIIGR
jgi:FAD/FMN-containing dehydrogenase